VLLPSLVLASALVHQTATAPAPPPVGWTLVWADEFDVDGPPDPAKWSFEQGFERNEEHQWYQPENAWIEGGHLIIEGRRESKPNPTYREGATDWRRSRKEIAYTSASLTTRGKQSWTFGRFEMRGKIDTRPGIWPAFWTVGLRGPWPAGGEIDIMEYYRGMLLANVAWASDKPYKPVWHDPKVSLADLGGNAWSSQFHTWRMDWDAEAIRLYVDDRLLNETRLKDTVNRDGSGRNPFLQPQILILNQAIGGLNGGDPSHTEFPARFVVDYVRVYQQQAAPQP
jgi:beta-glucanase (GH16 family)